MPAQSKAQQKFMGAVYALKKGDIKPSDASPEVRKVAKDMKKSDAKDFASTKHKNLPNRVRKEIIKRLKAEGKEAGPMVGTYALPSKMKKRKHSDTNNLGKRNKDGNSGQPDLEERLYVPSKFDKALDRLKFNQFTPNNIKKLSKKFKVDYKDAVEFIKQNKVINVANKPTMAEGSSFQRNNSRKPPAPYGGLNHHILNKSSVRKHDDDANFPKKDSGQEDLDEAKVETERFFGKKGIIIMIRDGNKMVSAIFKDKKNADKFNRNKPADVKKLLQLAKKTKFPKAIDENEGFASDAQRRAAFASGYKAKGKKGKKKNESKFAKKPEVTPKQLLKIQNDIRKINRKFRVYMSKHPVSKGELNIELGHGHDNDADIHKIYKVLQRHTGSWKTGRIFNEGWSEKYKKSINCNNPKGFSQKAHCAGKKKNESIAPNHDGKAAPYGSGYKKVDEVGVFPIKNYLKGMIPKTAIDTTTPQKRERLKSLIKDLVATLNDYWKSHNIPYRVKQRMKI